MKLLSCVISRGSFAENSRIVVDKPLPIREPSAQGNTHFESNLNDDMRFSFLFQWIVVDFKSSRFKNTRGFVESCPDTNCKVHISIKALM